MTTPVKRFCKYLLLAIGLMPMLSANAQDIENIADANPFEIHGTASASLGYYKTNSFNSTRRPLSYSILMSPILSVYGVQIPLNFTLTEASKNVSNPFAQFGINPYYKWAKAYLGWSNMSWSQGTLDGKTFLGAGVEINPGIFRMGAFYGRLNRPLRENFIGVDNQIPQYKRKGWGLKIGLGKEHNYVDFIWLHGKDDPTSIPAPKDTLNKIDYTPAENAVFGIKSHQAFGKKKRLVWDIDGAISAWTRDVNSERLDIGDGFGSGFINVAIPPRFSTSYAWTAHTAIGYKADAFSLLFDYSRIQPEYRSMGIDYLLNDQQKFTFTQTGTSKNKKVNLSFNQFYQHDNLNNRKALKTHRAGFNTTINYNANAKFGIVISYNNFDMFQTAGLSNLNDTTRLFQLQNTIVFVPRYTIISPKAVQNIYASLSYSRLDDLNEFTAKYSKSSTINTNLGYSLTIIKWQLTVAPSLNILNTRSPLIKLFNIGPTVAINKTLLSGKLMLSTSLSYIVSRINNSSSNNTITHTLGINYAITKNHAIGFNNNIMVTAYAGYNYHEYRGNIIYTYTFNHVVKKKAKQ